VIILSRLGSGMTIAVNPDLIERIEATPDTVITLVDGHKLVVENALPAVVDLVREWRASVAARALALTGGTSAGDPRQHEPSDALFADRAEARGHLGQVLQLPTREA
jgi:flagellar protein FlbD